MPPPDDLDEAVAEGIITADQVPALRAFLVARGADFTVADPDAEAIRFVRGFHDVFLAIGVVVLGVGVALAAFFALGDYGTLAGSIAGAVLAWVLAEVFTRRRRLALPSIVLCAGFTVACACLAFVCITTEYAPLGPRFDEASNPLTMILGTAAAGIVAALVFYARFGLPFALGAAAAALVSGYYFLAFLTVAGDTGLAAGGSAAGLSTDTWVALGALAIGLALFAVAMMFDLRDPTRSGLDADRAFWLHLVAAPVIVCSTLSLAGIEAGISTTLGDAAAVVAIVAALSLVAIVVDRRALLVAGLVSLGLAVGRVIEVTDLGDEAVIAVTLVLLGTAIVLLGAGWRTVRRAVIHLVPSADLRSRLPATR